MFGENIIDCFDLYQNPLPEIEYHVEQLIQKSGLNYIVGLPESFKTSFSLLIAIHGAIGKDVLCYKIPKPFTTLFIDEENGLVGTKFKLKQLLKGSNININDIKGKIYFSSIEHFKIEPTCIATLKILIKQYKPDLIVIDNITRTIIGDENYAKDVSSIQSLLKPLEEEFGIAFLIIHHKRKGNGGDMESARGSIDFGGQCDIMNVLEKVDDTKYKLSQGKRKYALRIEPINFTVIGDKERIAVVYAGTKDENIDRLIDKIAEKILTMITKEPAKKHKVSEILKELHEVYEFGSTYSYKALRKLKEHSVIQWEHGFCSICGGVERPTC